MYRGIQNHGYVLHGHSCEQPGMSTNQFHCYVFGAYSYYLGLLLLSQENSGQEMESGAKRSITGAGTSEPSEVCLIVNNDDCKVKARDPV